MKVQVTWRWQCPNCHFWNMAKRDEGVRPNCMNCKCAAPYVPTTADISNPDGPSKIYDWVD